MSRCPAADRRGLALPMVLFALVILGAVLTAAFLVSRLDRASATTADYALEAQLAAEAGLANRYAGWDPTVQGALPVWDGTPITEWGGVWANLGGRPQVSFVDSVRRLNQQLFLVRSTGRRTNAAGDVLAQLTVAQLFRLVSPTIGVNAAVTVQDPLTLEGNAFLIDGHNTLPPQWSAGECDPLDAGGTDDVVGVRSAVGTGVRDVDLDNVFGFPAAHVPNDPTITSATFRNFLDYTYTTLAAQPGVKVLPNSTPYIGVRPVLDPTTSPASCNRGAPLNLGEPFRNPPAAGAVAQCMGYFPVVHGTGAQTEFAADGRGQGTLLVDGDLRLRGNFAWVGLIIVRGRLQLSGNGNRITGAVLAEGANVASSGAVTGDVDIVYSACAVQRAIGGATVARPLNQRSWAQLF